MQRNLSCLTIPYLNGHSLTMVPNPPRNPACSGDWKGCSIRGSLFAITSPIEIIKISQQALRCDWRTLSMTSYIASTTSPKLQKLRMFLSSASLSLIALYDTGSVMSWCYSILLKITRFILTFLRGEIFTHTHFRLTLKNKRLSLCTHT